MKITQELKDLVIEEATNLKKYASAGELAGLDWCEIDPRDPCGCIYGQMTGSCFNKRAHELIIKCASRVYEANDSCEDDLPIGSKLNGAPYQVDGSDRNSKYFSPIEVYIDMNKKGDLRPLVAYLKGETNTLIL